MGTVFVDKYKIEWDVEDTFDSVNGLPLSFSASRAEILPECSPTSLCVGTSPEVSPLGVQVRRGRAVCRFFAVPVSPVACPLSPVPCPFTRVCRVCLLRVAGPASSRC